MFRFLSSLFGAGSKKSAATMTKLASKAGKKTSGSTHLAAAAAASQIEPEHDKDPYKDPIVDTGKSGFYFLRYTAEDADQVGAQSFDFETAQVYEEDLRRFYEADLHLFSDPEIFYEEMEQDFVRRRLPQEEQYFGQLDMFRLTLNDNVRAWYLKTPFLSGLLMIALQGIFSTGLFDLEPRFSVMQQNINIATLVLIIVSGAWTMFYFMMKAWFIINQQDTSQQLNNQLQERLGRIDSCLHKAVSNAQRTEETLSQEEEEKAPQKGATWVLAFQWLSMKTMFMERYLRNVLYQIKRNSAWYVRGGTILAATLTFINAGLPFIYMARYEAILLGSALLILGALRFFIRGQRDPFQVIRTRLATDNWQRFHRMAIWESSRKMIIWDKDKILDLKYQRFRGGRGPTS